MRHPGGGHILSFIEPLPSLAPLLHQRIYDKRSFTMRQSIYVLELPKLKLRSSFLVPLGRFSRAGGWCRSSHFLKSKPSFFCFFVWFDGICERCFWGFGREAVFGVVEGMWRGWWNRVEERNSSWTNPGSLEPRWRRVHQKLQCANLPTASKQPTIQPVLIANIKPIDLSFAKQSELIISRTGPSTMCVSSLYK